MKGSRTSCAICAQRKEQSHLVLKNITTRKKKGGPTRKEIRVKKGLKIIEGCMKLGGLHLHLPHLNECRQGKEGVIFSRRDWVGG